MIRTASLFAFTAASLALVPSLLAGKTPPDWSNSSRLGPHRARGVDAIDSLGGKLPEAARRNGVTPAELEQTLRQDHDFWVDEAGYLHCVCEGLKAKPSAPESTVTATGNPAYSAIANSTDALRLHSLPGSTRVIYLDFTGHTTSGTNWNSTIPGGGDIVSAPFDTDGNPAAFGAGEHDLIRRIWARVAEDFAGFAVDVTTEDPGLEALRKSTTSDNAYGIRVVISPSSAWYPNAGGVAYVGSFSAPNDLPCFVFSDKLGPNNEKYVAEAISHETGHTLGLRHDGRTDGTAYYQGHGDWAPIMGVGYYRPITQWSKGEYALANNLEDDITIMTNNGAPLALDDNGNTIATATPLTSEVAGATELLAAGVVERSSDVDVFSVRTLAGPLTISASGSSTQSNLDVALELLDASGAVLTSSNPAGLAASISQTVAGGTYYVRVRGTGYLDPVATGYSAYASTGEYILQATVIPPAGGGLAPVASASASTTSGVAPVTVTFDSSASTDADGSIVAREWNFGDGAIVTVTDPAQKTITHTFATVGTYSVVLKVVDNDGYTGTSSALVIAVGAAPNVAPVAIASVNSSSGYAPLALNFSGSYSTDSDGSVMSYAWNFGDGSSSALVSPTKTYLTPGTYTVTLTVTDNRGATGATALLITVTSDPNREIDLASLVLSRNANKAGTAVVATVRVLDRLGRAVAGTTVNAAWSGKVTGGVSGTTDAGGYVTFTSKRVKGSGTATLTVNSLGAPASYSVNSTLFTEPMSETTSW